jgi:hypothetical protein
MSVLLVFPLGIFRMALMVQSIEHEHMHIHVHVVHVIGPDVGKHVGLELGYFSYWKNRFSIVALINQADSSGCRYIRILMCSVSL